MTPKELLDHAKWLASFDYINHFDRPKISEQPGPEGYEDYTVVAVMGPEFVWMNETFPKEKFTWYLWFESVFLVPKEMLPFLILRWS